jgi:hypothetical protein
MARCVAFVLGCALAIVLTSCGSASSTAASVARCFRHHGWHVQRHGARLTVDGPDVTYDVTFHRNRDPDVGWTGYRKVSGPGPKVFTTCLR